MLHLVTTLATLFGVPDPSTRSHAWRVIDQIATPYRCDQACGPSISAARDTACIQAALNTVSVNGSKYNALELPNGVCHINAPLRAESAAHIAHGFEIYGQGSVTVGTREPWGGVSWQLYEHVVRGTVLKADQFYAGTMLTLGVDYAVGGPDPGADTLTLARTPSLLSVNDPVTVRCGTAQACAVPPTLTNGNLYYVKTIVGSTISLSLTPGGAAVDITSGQWAGDVHVSNSGGGKWKLHDFAMVGVDDAQPPTSRLVGLSLVGSSGAVLMDISGVALVNFATGLECYTCEDGVATGLGLYGNGIGLYADSTTNSNVWTGIDCGANNVCGLIDGGLNTFEGGTIQGSYQYGLRVRGGENRISGIYFEDQSTVGAAISLEKATSWVISGLSSTVGDGTITLTEKAPADDTQVFVWVDGSGGQLPGSVAYGTTYYVANSSGTTMKLRTASGGGGTPMTYDVGTGNGVGSLTTRPGRMRVATAAVAYGYDNIIENNHDGGEPISVWSSNNFVDEFAMTSLVLQKNTQGVSVRSYNVACSGDLGSGNICENFQDAGVHYQFSPTPGGSPGMSLEGATRLFYEMNTASGIHFSWECFDDLGYCRVRNSAVDEEYLIFNPHGGASSEVDVMSDAFVVTSSTSQFWGAIATNTINEYGPGEGVTIEGMLHLDGVLHTDSIVETTNGHGVTIDGLLLKDGNVDGVKVSALSGSLNVCTSAAGDGVTDDYTALQTCIDATPTGGTLVIPEGIYLITSGLWLPNAIEVVGQGTSSQTTGQNYAFGNASWASATLHGTVIKANFSAGTMMTMANNDPRYIVRNIAFWCTAVGFPTTTGLLIQTSGGNLARPIVENVAAYNLYKGVSVSGDSARIEDLFLVGNRYGLYLTGYGATVINTRAETNTAGIYLPDAGSVTTSIIGGKFASNTLAIYSVGAHSTHISGVTFTGNTAAIEFDKSGGGGTGTGGGANHIDSCNFLTNDPITVYSDGNNLEIDGTFSGPTITLMTGAKYNYTYGNGDTLFYTDSSGQTNFKVLQGSTGLAFTDSASVLMKAGNITAGTAYVDGIADQGGATAFMSLDESTHAITIQGPGGIAINSGDVTLGSGVDLDTPASLKTDTVSEHTAAAGVTVDGVLLKDADATIGTTGGGNVAHIIHSGMCAAPNTCTPSGLTTETVWSKDLATAWPSVVGSEIVWTGAVLKDADANSVSISLQHVAIEEFAWDTESSAHGSWTWEVRIRRVTSTTASYNVKLWWNNSIIRAKVDEADWSGDPSWSSPNRSIGVRLTNGTQANDATVLYNTVEYIPAVP